MMDKILNDIRVELLDEFDQNFERKAFFDKEWKESRRISTRGSLLARTNTLRRSISGEVNLSAGSVRFVSNCAYGSIHNEGGEIVVTEKMKRYFWAKYMEVNKAVAGAKGRKSEQLTGEAGFFKAMALKKVGSKVAIPERRFLGDHEQVRGIIRDIASPEIKNLVIEAVNNLRKVENIK